MSQLTADQLTVDDVLAIYEQAGCPAGSIPEGEFMGALTAIKGPVQFPSPAIAQQFRRDLHDRYDKLMRENSFHE